MTSEVTKALARERADAVRRLADLEQLHLRIVDASRDDNADDEHDTEGQTIAWDRAQNSALVDATKERIAEIDRATKRFEDGWDGSCAACGAPIPHERLLARPTATRCVACA